MQLVAGRTAQEFSQRKHRHGAFWEDRYHATAIEGGEHLQRCLVCIDLNMVRTALEKYGMKRGVAAPCIGGGEAAATAIERIR